MPSNRSFDKIGKIKYKKSYLAVTGTFCLPMTSWHGVCGVVTIIPILITHFRPFIPFLFCHISSQKKKHSKKENSLLTRREDNRWLFMWLNQSQSEQPQQKRLTLRSQPTRALPGITSPLIMAFLLKGTWKLRLTAK